MRTVDIPGGAATLRERREEFKVRQRRVYETAVAAAFVPMRRLLDLREKGEQVTGVDLLSLGISRQEAAQMTEVQDAVIVAALAEWTLDQPLPDMDTLGDLDPDVYDALVAAVKEMKLAELLSGVDFEPSDPRTPGFEQTPTEPSHDSEQSSRADQEPALIGST